MWVGVCVGVCVCECVGVFLVMCWRTYMYLGNLFCSNFMAAHSLGFNRVYILV